MLSLAMPCAGASQRLDGENLVGYWRLNSNADDYSGYGNDGTWAGDESYGVAPWGQTTGEFGGDDDYVDSNATLISNTAFSISAWINSDTQGTTQTIISQWKSGTSNRLQFIKVTANTVAFSIGGSSYAITSAVNADQWYHVVGTYDGATLTVYIDGEFANSDSYSSGVEQDADTIIGTYSSGEYFNGQIAEARVYDIALTNDEILTLYHRNLPQFTAPTQPIDTLPDVADSTLAGAWLNKAVNGATDLSSNNNDGTATAVTWMDVGGDFDGSSSNVDCGDITAEYEAKANITVCAWVNTDNAGARQEIIGDNNVIVLRNNASALQWITNVGSWDTLSSTGFTTVAGQWYYLCGTYDGTTKRLYIDGSENNTVGETGNLATHTSNFYIGYRQGGADNYFNGQLKDARIYSEAKSADWIAKEYAKSVPDDDLVLHVTDGVEDKSRYRTSLTSDGVVIGNRMEFAGAGYISAGDITARYEANDEITIVTWYNTNTITSGDHDIISDSSAVILRQNDGLNFQWITKTVGGWNTLESSTGVLKDIWYHVAINYDGTNKYIYVNGVNVGSVGETTNLATHTDSMEFGRRNTPNNYVDGTISDVRIYNTAKSADWIAQDYKRTKKFY